MLEKLLHLSEVTEMSEHNKSLLACRVNPTIKDILNAIDEVANSDSPIDTAESRVESILKVSNACKQGLEIVSDLCLSLVKPRWADLTDAGPGVGVSNYEVRFRDPELARIHNSDYRVRCHRSRGDSGQGEADRTNSAISDALVDIATLEWEKYRRFEDLSKDEIKAMSLHSYERYEKERMEKNAWHVCKQVAERIDDPPVLKDYISSRVSESPEELFFFDASELNTYRNASENSKAEIPGAAYFSKIESFIEDHYDREELFFEFCWDGCKEQRDASSTLCSWCTNNRWVGPETERIPQPVPDKQNSGHFMDVYETPTTGRTPDDYQLRKCLKDLYEQNAISAGNPNTVAAFCATYNGEEKHVIEYLGHRNDINIRKDIRTREAKEKRRLEGELTYKDYQWGTLIENGKVEKLKVKQLDLYLREHGLTTVGLKLDKIKAIRIYYYRQKSPGNGNELSSCEEESEESDTESDDDENSEDDLVIADLDEQ